MPRHYTIARNPLLRQAEILDPMLDQLVDFLKTSGIKQQFNAFPRQQFSLLVLTLLALGSASCFGSRYPEFKFSPMLLVHAYSAL